MTKQLERKIVVTKGVIQYWAERPYKSILNYWKNELAKLETELERLKDVDK